MKAVLILSIILVCPFLAFSSSRKELEEELMQINNVDSLIAKIDLFKLEKSIYNFIPFSYPLDQSKGAVISSPFGERKDPFHRRIVFHKGIDIASKKGTHVYATCRGEISFVGEKGGYGKCVIIENRYGFKVIYAHLNEVYAHKKGRVKKGTKIGFVGSTGRSTGNHLHYEIHKNDSIIDPNLFLNL